MRREAHRKGIHLTNDQKRQTEFIINNKVERKR